jgi:putative glycosyltransferase (TIGR04372 family)
MHSLDRRLRVRRHRLDLGRQLVFAALKLAAAVLGLFPCRLVFVFLVAADLLRLPFRRRLALAYQPYVLDWSADNPGQRLASFWTRPFVSASARALHGVGAYGEACELVIHSGRLAVSDELNHILAASLFEQGEFKAAREAAAILTRTQIDPERDRLKAMLELIAGNVEGALGNFETACFAAPRLLQPHQNLSARADQHYVPNAIDVAAGAPGRLYDLANFTGQRVTHVGRGDLGVPLYARALKAQHELCEPPPPNLSPELSDLLLRLGIGQAELRIIPVEWTTQIGHMGMLDILFRMKALGWWEGKPVMVIYPTLEANAHFVRLFERYAFVLTVGRELSEKTAAELLSLQRWYGLGFNAFEHAGGEIVAWQEAGARALRKWEQDRRSPPLRRDFDTLFGASVHLRDSFAAVRKRWGMKPTDWYVCLHVREPSHYLEIDGTGQTHRNADIRNYLAAIRHITERGGWVIKLGSRRSPRLPRMSRVIDYSRSSFKSDLMDLYLIRNAKFFIGTTSGLTNVAISFGTPCALVNCITSDAQPWSGNVRFALKPVLTLGGPLSQRQMTTAPWRWRLFDAAVIHRHRGNAIDNSSEEILETVREVDALVEQRSEAYEQRFDTMRLISLWRQQLIAEDYYGAARPSLYYLDRHKSEFLGGEDQDLTTGEPSAGSRRKVSQ